MDLLAGLDNAERAACRVAERVLGVSARAWDTGSRQGAVDAFPDYPDGRSAAFEVTRPATDRRALQLDNLLGADDSAWPLPGTWWWTVTVNDVRDLPASSAASPQWSCSANTTACVVLRHCPCTMRTNSTTTSVGWQRSRPRS